MPENQRILLKLSGEILMGDKTHGVDLQAVHHLATEIKEVRDKDVEIAIVIGGGNIFRGRDVSKEEIESATADYMGMLATVINALALQEMLESHGLATRVMSAIEISAVCEVYIRRRAVHHLDKGMVVIFAAGTGNPFFTTDTAASLRAVEIGADLLLKATKVDGIYDSDPERNPDAKLYPDLSYSEVIQKGYAVMDTTAVVLCRDNNLPIRVFSMHKPKMLSAIIDGQACGTLVS